MRVLRTCIYEDVSCTRQIFSQTYTGSTKIFIETVKLLVLSMTIFSTNRSTILILVKLCTPPTRGTGRPLRETYVQQWSSFG